MGIDFQLRTSVLIGLLPNKPIIGYVRVTYHQAYHINDSASTFAEARQAPETVSETRMETVH